MRRTRMAAWLLCVALVTLEQSAFVSGQTTSGCSGIVQGSWYNLTALSYDPSGLAPVGYNYTRANNIEFYINFCQSVSNSSASPLCNADGPSGACQQSNTEFYPAGLVSSEQLIPYQPLNVTDIGVGLQYSNGTYCSGTGEHRATTIYVTCDPSGMADPHIYNETSVGCNYILYFISQYGCPTQVVSSSASPSPSQTISATPSHSPSVSVTPYRTNAASLSSSISRTPSVGPTSTPTFTPWGSSQVSGGLPPWVIVAVVLLSVALLCLGINAWLALRRRKKRQRNYSLYLDVDDDVPAAGSVNAALAQHRDYDSVSERGSFVLAG